VCPSVLIFRSPDPHPSDHWAPFYIIADDMIFSASEADARFSDLKIHYVHVYALPAIQHIQVQIANPGMRMNLKKS